MPEPPPPGRVWLVYQKPPGGRWLSAQLRRMGWQAEVKYGYATALEQARDRHVPRPDAVLITEQAMQPTPDLIALRAALPDACVHLLVRPDWHAPALADQVRAASISIIVAPPLPAQLLRLHVRPNGSAASPVKRAAVSDMEVLLVEDNDVNQLLGQEFLRTLGLRSRLAIDGHEAIQACLERTPALVLMDLQMPRMDGLQATRQLRALQNAGRWPGCPIIVLTAHAGPEEHQACQAAGVDGLLTKPLALETLRHTLAQWLPLGPAI